MQSQQVSTTDHGRYNKSNVQIVQLRRSRSHQQPSRV